MFVLLLSPMRGWFSAPLSPLWGAPTTQKRHLLVGTFRRAGNLLYTQRHNFVVSFSSIELVVRSPILRFFLRVSLFLFLTGISLAQYESGRKKRRMGLRTTS